jgi:hypothetical protein
MSETTLPTKESKHAIGVDDRGALQYRSAAASGHIEIVVPSLSGSPNATERLHARDFGQHIIGKIESAMNRQGYMTSGPTQGPAEVFKHYAAVAKGAGLMDSAAIGRMEQIAAEFAKEPEQEAYWKMVAKPYLGALTPKRRK